MRSDLLTNATDAAPVRDPHPPSLQPFFRHADSVRPEAHLSEGLARQDTCILLVEELQEFREPREFTSGVSFPEPGVATQESVDVP